MKEDEKYSLLNPSKHKYGVRDRFYNKFTLIIVLLCLVILYQIVRLETPNEVLQLRIAAMKKWSMDKSKFMYTNPVDSLDGIGYDFQRRQKVEMDPRYNQLNQQPLCDLSNDPMVPANDVVKIIDAFQNCIQPIFDEWKEDPHSLAYNWVNITTQCDSIPEVQNLKITGFRNLHEIKWAILPKCKEENSMVTLGIGHDTLAEERLNVTVPNTKFYGADPIIEPNLQLYSAFGRFFPFAIGKEAGISTFKILPNQNQNTRRYMWQDVTTIDFVYFLNDVIQMKKIDFMWIDIEGGEFQFIDMLNKMGPLDNKGITICQFNLEIHAKVVPPGEIVFRDFIEKVLMEKRWIFLKPMRTGEGVFRMFFINMENEECLRKFIL